MRTAKANPHPARPMNHAVAGEHATGMKRGCSFMRPREMGMIEGRMRMPELRVSESEMRVMMEIWMAEEERSAGKVPGAQ